MKGAPPAVSPQFLPSHSPVCLPKIISWFISSQPWHEDEGEEKTLNRDPGREQYRLVPSVFTDERINSKTLSSKKKHCPKECAGGSKG